MTEEAFEDLVFSVFSQRFGPTLKTVVFVATCDDSRGVSQDVRLIHEVQKIDDFSTKPAGSEVAPSGTTGPELRHKPADAEHY
jgi:hypothetical protein